MTARVTTPVSMLPQDAVRRDRLPWPLPALLAWAAGWLAWGIAAAAGLGAAPAAVVGLVGGAALALCTGGWRRRGIAAAGFPLSAWMLGAAAPWPSWVWGALLLPLLAAYPLRAWRDAPLFPTPPDGLQGLDAVVQAPGRVLDAGCGLGHGLAALRRVWPHAELQGIEWSPLLAAAARWRLWRAGTGARVRQGDMWKCPWQGNDVVYVFQRPETMARAHAKAVHELAPGAWLVSLEFAVPGVAPQACLQGDGRRSVWVYRMPGPTGTAAGHIPG